MVESKSRT
jgi:hypothetical protein